MKEFSDVVLGTFTDVAKMLRSLLSSRTTWVMLLGFIAVYVSSGKIEAFQQLLAYLGLGSIWVIKMGAQNVMGIVKGNGKPAFPIKPVTIFEPEAKPEVKPLAPVTPPCPFDVKTFHEMVIADAEIKYKTKNPTPVEIFYQAETRGGTVTCTSLKQAVDYWHYLVELVKSAEEWAKLEDEKSSHGVCYRPSPEYLDIKQRMYDVIVSANNVIELADSGLDWRTPLAQNNSLFHIGVLAYMVLGK